MSLHIKIFPLFFILSCGQVSTEKINFYLPHNFRGTVLIIYDCKDGIELKRDANNVTNVLIPDNGILKVSNKSVYGRVKELFFAKNNNGKYSELPIHYSYEKDIKDSVYVGPGTTVNISEIPEGDTIRYSQTAYTFYVHRNGEIFGDDYNDRWIKDTMSKQILINKQHIQNVLNHK